jgi:hypothetical protein
MRRLLCLVWLTASLVAVSVSPAVADDGYWLLDFNTHSGPALPLRVGVDEGEGQGFGFVTYIDDNGDGVIKLPPIPVGSRLALGVNHTGSSVDPDCLIWDFVGTSAHVGGTSISVPLLIVAEDIEGEALGIDFGELAAPPLALTPGDRLTVTDGILPGWPGIRLVNDSGVPDLETFIAVVDTLPDFNGDVVVSNTVVRFTLVPEPSTFALATLGMLGVACRRRKHT